ncbi:hypothetical protein [Vibrio diabolicus]|uniref:Uncharacterized protein n=1 Tax=Vibrio diabolicus TaxID=50719 RepID=A0ABM6SJE5_9VIBR|nr:hypothetical protein [Vibrio diabolicus]PLX65475.1 MAG: hypothetical protein C0632_01160 [Vibrio alginolyticus]AVH30271.1 hypothetical protein AL468_24575 [Vibrio diabolicus]MCG9619084.1 hypothetical protein [Vibrio diabolicus]MCR9306885.1 hypothetical protein [Vibrio diabolicus]MCS0331435.1 hypothetical protein [Vibrio diabolicus]
MAHKRILPIPLILLIPIVLLVVVVIAGVYRFSLSDEEIMAKFPQTEAETNVIVQETLGITSRNPWTIQVPEQGAVTFLDEWDKENGYLIGDYDAGATKGQVLVPTAFISQREIESVSWIAAPMIVTTQGSGSFNYVGLFKFDPVPSRVVLLDSIFVGDRVKFTQITWESDAIITLSYLAHGDDQAMADTPNQLNSSTLKRVGNNLHMQQ